MQRGIPFLFAAMFALAGIAEAGVMSDTYAFPVVVKNTGVAGSVWQTELCLNNPNDFFLIVNILLVQRGDIEHSLRLGVPEYEVACTQDFLNDWFLLSKWTGGLILFTEPEDHATEDPVMFGASVRVYSWQPDGTFGLNVEPEIDPYLYQGSMLENMTNAAVASGVNNTGEPGVSGFRTSFGAFNVTDSDQMVTVQAYSADGVVVWTKDVTVPAMSQKQWAIPRGVEIWGGGIDAVNNSDGLLFGYITVTDNRTGDGLYRPFQTIYEFGELILKSKDAAFDAIKRRFRHTRSDARPARP